MQNPDSEYGITRVYLKGTGRDWSGARGTGVERDRQERDRQAGRQAGLVTGRGPGVEERQG